MSLSTLFEKIAGRQKARERAKFDDYRSLVAEIADGKEPDAEVLHAVLHDNGKSLDDLKASVEKLQRRRKMRADYDALPALDAERRDVEEKLCAADRVLEAAEAQHEEATRPLFAKLGELRKAISEGRLARHELERSCEHPDVLADLDALRVELQDANNRRAMLETESRRLHESAESDRDEAGYVPLRGDVERLRNRADEREAQAKQMEEELIGLRKRIAELDARDAAIRERMLVP